MNLKSPSRTRIHPAAGGLRPAVRGSADQMTWRAVRRRGQDRRRCRQAPRPITAPFPPEQRRVWDVLRPTIIAVVEAISWLETKRLEEAGCGGVSRLQNGQRRPSRSERRLVLLLRITAAVEAHEHVAAVNVRLCVVCSHANRCSVQLQTNVQIHTH